MADYGSNDLARDIVKRRKGGGGRTTPRHTLNPPKKTPPKKATYTEIWPQLPRGSEDQAVGGQGRTDYNNGLRRAWKDKIQTPSKKPVEKIPNKGLQLNAKRYSDSDVEVAVDKAMKGAEGKPLPPGWTKEFQRKQFTDAYTRLLAKPTSGSAPKKSTVNRAV